MWRFVNGKGGPSPPSYSARGSSTLWKSITGTGRAGANESTTSPPATGAIAAMRSAASAASRYAIIAPFDRRAKREIVEQREREPNVVHVIVGGVAAAAPGVEGQQAVAPATGSVGVDGEEALAVRQRVHVAMRFVVSGVATSSVEVHDHGE